MRKKLIVGNWKMNKNLLQTEQFIKELKLILKENSHKIPVDMEFGIAAPAIHIHQLTHSNIEGLDIYGQNMHQKDSGAFTGEISADMLASYGAKGTLIGHSERRAYFGETDEQINQKVKLSIARGLVPIVCVGEVLDEFERGITKDVIKRQIQEGLDGVEATKIVIAYEPVWAIGTGKSANAQIAQDVIAFIRSITSKDTIILYGGSVTPDNVVQYLAQPDIDGALVGGASLTPESFVKLITLNQ